MNAIGYTRLSQTSATSIENQTENIEEYATSNGLELVEILNDGEYSSGFDEEREKYQELLDRLDSIDVVITNDNQRLARDPDEAMEVVLNLRRSDVQYHTCDEGQIDLSRPLDAVIAMMRAVVEGEAKRREINKAKEAIQKRQDDGYYQGRPPFGLKINSESKRLEKDHVEWQRCEQIWESGKYDGTSEWRVRKRGREYYEDLLEQYG